MSHVGAATIINLLRQEEICDEDSQVSIAPANAPEVMWKEQTEAWACGLCPVNDVLRLQVLKATLLSPRRERR
jgi:hypothetical protein